MLNIVEKRYQPCRYYQ